MTKAILLSAGRGERLSPLTDHTPKPLLLINDKPIIVYLIEKLSSAGIKNIIINISHLAKQFPEKLGDGSQFGVTITYSYEPEALESGGGILQALPLLGDQPFLVISGDIFTDYPFETLPAKMHGLAHLVLAPNPDFHPEGDYSLTEQGFLSKAPPKFTFASFGILHPKLFEGCEPGKFSYITLINKLIGKDLVSGEIYKGLWHNIGTNYQLKQLQTNKDNN